MVADRPTTLVDSCVLLDVLTDDPTWSDWSDDALARARDLGPVVINPIVYAEVAAGFDTIEERDVALPDFYIGAHAVVARHRLLTRYACRFRTYCPRLEVIAPIGS